MSYWTHLPVPLYHETLKSKRTFHIGSSISQVFPTYSLYVGKKEGREEGRDEPFRKVGNMGERRSFNKLMFNSRDAEMTSKQMGLGSGAQEKHQGQVQTWEMQ